MRLLRSWHNIPQHLQGGFAAIGNFDGIHAGHQKLIQLLIEKAASLHCPKLLITFEPHPRDFFSPRSPVARLTNFHEKYAFLQTMGIDAVLVLGFREKLSQLSADHFILQLQNGLKFTHLIVGEDFHFGKDQIGDTKLLKHLGQQKGFGLTLAPTLSLNNKKISSSRVRLALQHHDLPLAKALLQRPYVIQGRIVHGKQLGRTIGFPTANIHLKRRLVPLTGVYAVKMHGLSDVPLCGVANIGTRPTVDGSRTLLEVHLLDFNEDIYHCFVSIEFCFYIRAEQHYASLELLKQQIALDVKATHDYFTMSYIHD